MIDTSTQFQNAVNSYNREWAYRVTFNGSDVITGADLLSASVTNDFNGSKNLTMGASCSNKFECRMIMPVTQIPLTNASVLVECGLLVGNSYEYITLGKYNTAEIKSNDGYKTVYLTCFDDFIFTDKEYIPSSDITFPTTMQAVVEDIAEQCNLTVSSNIPYNNDIELPEELFVNVYTCRQMLGYMAGLVGKNAVFNNSGELTFKWYTDSGVTLDGTSILINGYVKKSEETITIQSIVTGTSANPITVGTGRAINFTNPFITADVAQSILDDVSGLSFVSADVKFTGNPSIECGDIITVSLENTQDTILVMKEEINFKSGNIMTLYSKEQTEAEYSFSSSPTDQKIQASYTKLENAFIETTDYMKGKFGGYVIQGYDAQGFPNALYIADRFVTITNGVADDPNTNMWIWNSGGLGFSSDGGESYSRVAITDEGGITADAITTGKLNASLIYSGDDQLTEYVKIGNGQIELGTPGNDDQLTSYVKIGNSQIELSTPGNNAKTTITSNSYEVDNVGIIRFGDYAFYLQPGTNIMSFGLKP